MSFNLCVYTKAKEESTGSGSVTLGVGTSFILMNYHCREIVTMWLLISDWIRA